MHINSDIVHVIGFLQIILTVYLLKQVIDISHITKLINRYANNIDYFKKFGMKSGIHNFVNVNLNILHRGNIHLSQC